MTMNTPDNTQAPTTNDTNDLDAWTMATSILIGLSKAQAKAKAEYDALAAANPGKPYAPGMTKAAHLAEALRDARKDLGPDLRAIARANNLPMPEIKR